MSRLVFKNYGGSYQLEIQDAQDLEKIQILDETRWAATSIPVSSLNCDATFTSYVDTDKNGRIRTDEFKAAQEWLFKLLSNRSRLSEGTDVLILDNVDVSHPEGKKMMATAKRILTNLNSPDAREINLNEVRDVKNIMARADTNGDGVIPPVAASNPDLAGFIVSIMETVGSTVDASGQSGISEEQLKVFLEDAEAYLIWKEKGKIPKGSQVSGIMPWGVETPAAFELISKLEGKIEQYFTQCNMIKFDERTAVQMRLRQKELEEIDFSDKLMMEARLKDAPLALPNAKGSLNLDKAINPLYAVYLVKFRDKVLKRALGKLVKELSKEKWNRVKAIFAPYREWLENKRGEKVEKLGEDKLRRYLKGTYRQQLSQLIVKDRMAAKELDQIHNLEKLILYQRWLMELANNFVNFSNFYDPERCSLFETGTLVIDGRQMTFTMKVHDRTLHKKIAERSFIFLMYLEITGRKHKDVDLSIIPRGTGEQNRTIKFEIVTAVTSGSAGRLCLGKRGVFFTTDGQEWDAEVVDIVENPISIGESIRAPFQQFTGLIKKQVEKFTQTSQAKLEGDFAKPSASGMTRDLLLGGGIAIAALGSAFAYITKALSQVRAVHILGVLLGVVVIVLLPGIISGFIKIRKRDMSVILEASGWAVNVHLRLNAVLGQLFTHLPPLPKGARKRRRDMIKKLAREFGYSSFQSRKLTTAVLVTLFILALIFFLDAFTPLEIWLIIKK